ncbi:aldo/keto reductase [Oxalobacteraceae bacterium A2-2]
MLAEPITEAELPVADIDALLASHRFGEHQYLTEQMHAAYLRRLDRLALALPEADLLLARLAQAKATQVYRTLGDTVVRCAIQHAQVQVETGDAYGMPLAMCQAVMEMAAHDLASARPAPLGGSLSRHLDQDAELAWVWQPDCPDSVYKQAFAHVLSLDYGQEQPCALNQDELAMLDLGVGLLRQLLPASAHSALTHTHLAVFFPERGVWAGRLSSSEYRLSGTVFLSRRMLANPWTLAEHLYHESLHQQFYDLRAGHTLLAPDFTRTGAPLIHSPWNRPDATRNNYWDVHRALAAFHVYTHLALLCEAAGQRSDLQEEYGPAHLVGRRTALARAHYLGEQIGKLASRELGPAGQRFLSWFNQVLELLDEHPPAAGADVHLLLDRYWREAVSLASIPPERSAAWSSALASMAQQESQTARAALTAVPLPTDSYDRALERLEAEQPAQRFTAVRQLVVQTVLSQVTPDYRLSPSGQADAIIRNMVEDASAQLQWLLDGSTFGPRRALPGHATAAAIASHAERSGTARNGWLRQAQDLLLSSVGLGTYRGNLDLSTDEGYAATVHAALGGGINLIDTAINYRHQRSELCVGEGLRRFIEDGGSREAVVVCTKGGYLTPGAITPAALEGAAIVGKAHCIAPSFLADQIERSRRNLGLETLDIYYLHNPEHQLDEADAATFEERLRRAFGRLEQAVSEGKLRWYGAATWHGCRDGSLSLPMLAGLAREVAGPRHHFRFLQLPINLQLRNTGDKVHKVLEQAAELGISVIASAALGQGRLQDPPWLAALPGLASPAQRCLQFVRSTPGLTAALAGTSQPSHVQNNLGLAAVAPLSAAEYGRLERAMPPA